MLFEGQARYRVVDHDLLPQRHGSKNDWGWLVRDATVFEQRGVLIGQPHRLPQCGARAMRGKEPKTSA